MSFEKQPQKKSLEEVISNAENSVFEKVQKEEVIEKADAKKTVKINEEDLKKINKSLNKIPEKQTGEFLSQVDPRNQGGEIESQYHMWRVGNPEIRNHKMISWGSKISNVIGRLLIGSPNSLGLPDYIYYLPQDREVCFPDLFENIDSYEVSRNVLYVNRVCELLRKDIYKKLSMILLVIGIAFGTLTVGVKKVNDMWNQHKETVRLEQQIKDQAETDRQNKLTQIDNQLNTLQDQENKLIERAKQMKAQLGDNPDPQQVENLKAQFKTQDDQLKQQIDTVTKQKTFVSDKEKYTKAVLLVKEKEQLKNKFDSNEINESDFKSKIADINSQIKSLEQ